MRRRPRVTRARLRALLHYDAETGEFHWLKRVNARVRAGGVAGTLADNGYRRARAAVRYGDVASTLVHGLKYGDRLDLAPLMGRWMANAGRELTRESDLLVPVPLHWRRQWARR